MGTFSGMAKNAWPAVLVAKKRGRTAKEEKKGAPLVERETPP